MAIGRRDLVAKARAFTISIGKLSKDERRLNPSGKYGADYNHLRDRAAQLYPHLESILPPAVRIARSTTGDFTDENYAEVDTFCEQIVQILTEQGDDQAEE